MKATLERLVRGESLDRAQARDAMLLIMSGQASSAQIAAFLVALRIKGETVDEITGLAQGMRSVSRRLDLGVDVVDTCGTGGDGASTFNVSTAAALVAAGAGVPIAKHGNRAVSSACGSADVLEALGVELSADEATLERCLEHAGIAFLFAPARHPAMKHAIGPRQELGLRTVFNVLGPLTNPAGARRQVMGVYAASLVAPLARVLGELGAEHALVVHGAGGLDEISTCGPTTIAEWNSQGLSEWTLEPTDLGLARAEVSALSGGSADDNAAMIVDILDGQSGARRDIVLLNAAATIYVSGIAPDLPAALESAREAIDSGAARAALDRLIAVAGGGS